MKQKIILIVFLFATRLGHSQGTTVIDQQSTNLVEGVAGLYNYYQPLGQSFTPSLSSVQFISLNLYDGDPSPSLGGTVRINLRSNSITGTILGISTAVFLPDDFFGVTNFVFSAPVAVSPGVTYYFQPVIESGNLGVGSFVTDGSYTGGTEIYQGVPITDRDLWFQEGITVIPEPSSAVLALLGGGVWLFVRRWRSLVPKKQAAAVRIRSLSVS